MMRDETIKMTFIYMMNMDANKTEVITADPHFNRAVIFQIIIFDLYKLQSYSDTRRKSEDKH